MHLFRRLFRRSGSMARTESTSGTLGQKIGDEFEDGNSRPENISAGRSKRGDVTLADELPRGRWWSRIAESAAADLKYALRQLYTSPAFTLTALTTLSLGIGANTAIFTLVHAVLMKSLPVVEPKTLYRVGDRDDCCAINGFSNREGDFSIFSYDLYKHLRDGTQEFEELAAMQAGNALMGVRRGSEIIKSEPSEFVSGNYFTTFGISPYLGRLLIDADDKAGASPVAVMSYEAWRSEYAGDPALVGQTLFVQGQPFTLIGVAPRGFFGDRISNSPSALWIPLADEPIVRQDNTVLKQADENWLYLIGRIKSGVNIRSVQDKLSINLRQWLATQDSYTRNGGSARIATQYIVMSPGGAGIQNLQQQTRKGLYLLMAISGLMLLVACASLGNLLVARSVARGAEMSLRTALGATRSRLIRQMLTESILLGCLGGLAGLAVSYAGTRAILALAFPGATHISVQASPSGAVLGFTLLLSILTGILFGIAPAWMTSRGHPAETLRAGTSSQRVPMSTFQKSLIVFQTALSLVLLMGAGLLTKSLRNLEHQNFGLQTASRYVIHLDPGSAGYTPEKLDALNQALVQQFGALPGMQSVGLALYSPLEGNNWALGVFVEGRPPVGPKGDIGSSFDRVSPQFFETVGEPIIRGRSFTDHDTATSPMVAVVNQTFAKKFFPNEDSIGKHFGNWNQQYAGTFEVVGVVADAKYFNPRESTRPMFFRPLAQWKRDLPKPTWVMLEKWSLYVDSIVMRFHGEPQNLDAMVRRALANVDPNLTIISLHTLDFQVEGNFSQERLIGRLTMLFSLLALLLASVGLYGITSYVVSRRTSEIGVRMAVGANRFDVVWLVLGEVLRRVGLGLVIGVAIALLAARGIRDQLYQVRSYDPLSLLLAAGVLTAAATVAGLIPARRAASIEPTKALRVD